MKNLNKQVILSLVILLGFSSFVANAEEVADNALPVPSEVSAKMSIQEVTEVEPTLAICDHNGDGDRNLIDVGMFAKCQNTFDANGNGIHESLIDSGIYATNRLNDNWCATEFVCEVASKPVVEPILVVVEPTLAICDHNGDGDRNLIDVGMFAKCQNTFDANGNGIHESLIDSGIYATNRLDDNWCATEFVCEVAPVVVETPSVASSAPISTPTLAICDHNGDGKRNLIDVQMFAECKDTFDADGNGIHEGMIDAGVYATNRLDNTWCERSFQCIAIPVVEETPIAGGSTSFKKPEPKLEVLGEKIEAEEVDTCEYKNLDVDVLDGIKWEDGTLLRGCGPEVYIIENQQKRHITSLNELFKYIGQRIYNVKDSVLNLF